VRSRESLKAIARPILYACIPKPKTKTNTGLVGQSQERVECGEGELGNTPVIVNQWKPYPTHVRKILARLHTRQPQHGKSLKPKQTHRNTAASLRKPEHPSNRGELRNVRI